jgi:hypothetical protein
MVLPGLFGRWVDQKFGTSWITFVGFGGGIAAALAYLLAVTSAASRRASDSLDKRNGESQS